MNATQPDLKSWREARKKALARTSAYKSCSPTARRLARHMVASRDAQDGSGMFRSPRKTARELGVSERTVRYALAELVERRVFVKQRRKDPRGTGKRDTTSAYRIHPDLGMQPAADLSADDTSCTPGCIPVCTPRRPYGREEDPPSGDREEELPPVAQGLGSESQITRSAPEEPLVTEPDTAIADSVIPLTYTVDRERERAMAEYLFAYLAEKGHYPPAEQHFEFAHWTTDQFLGKSPVW